MPQTTADQPFSHTIRGRDAVSENGNPSLRFEQGTSYAMKKFHLVTVFVLALSAASHAADLPLPVKAPIYAPPPLLSWEGSYVGILGGVANHRANLDPNCTTNIGCETTELTRTGGTIGALLGHNWQQGNFVYGMEADWTWLGGIKTSIDATEISQRSTSDGLALFAAAPGSPSTRRSSTSLAGLPSAASITASSRTSTTED